MNVKKTVKKIVALGAGAGLVGMTLASAFAIAPDLADYPDFMVENGQFNGKIVVGAQAASQDIVGGIDIAASLQAASTTETAIEDGTTTTTIEGDAAKIGESSDLLEIGEFVGDVVNTLTDDDLAMLQGGRVTTAKGSTDFTQTLDLDTAQVDADHKEVILAEDNDDETGFYLFFNDGEEIFSYELEFTSGLESDLDADDVADDLEDESIFMLGQYYSIVSATSDGTDLTLELIAGDVVDTLTQGQTKTYTVDGTDYEVTVLVIGNDGADVKFLVNGEVTDSLGEGETDTLSDGLELGVREIIETNAYRESDPGSVVEFYLGANKIEFDLTTSGAAGDVEINRENIEDAEVTVTYTATANDNIRISNIQYTLDADADKGTDIFVAEGEGIRELLDEPEGMLNAEWDIMFAGVSSPAVSEIAFNPNGDDEYVFEFVNRRGDEYSVPYAYIDGSADVKFGDEDDDFFFYERYDEAADGAGTFTLAAAMFHIGDSDYFLLTDDEGTNQGDSYVLQWEDIDTDETTLSFVDKASGDNMEVVYTAANVLLAADLAVGADLVDFDTSFPAAGQITKGGQNFDFWIFDATGGNYFLAVDMDGDGDLAGGAQEDDGVDTEDFTTTQVTVRGGGFLDLYADAGFPDQADLNNGWTVDLTTDDEDIDSDGANMVNTLDFSDDNVDQLDVDFGAEAGFYGSGAISIDGEDRDVAVNQYGTYFEITDETDEADTLVITYPHEQVEALVYVVGGDVASTTSTSGGSTSTRVNVLPVGLAVLDTEIAVDDTNLIVVGGPCANTVAADLLDNPADCTEGFEAGMGMIRSFDTGDNVAVLVAGFSARDTVETSQVLAEAAVGAVSGLEGDNVEVVIAGANDVTVRAATVEEMDDMEDDMEA